MDSYGTDEGRGQHDQPRWLCNVDHSRATTTQHPGIPDGAGHFFPTILLLTGSRFGPEGTQGVRRLLDDAEPLWPSILFGVRSSEMYAAKKRALANLDLTSGIVGLYTHSING